MFESSTCFQEKININETPEVPITNFESIFNVNNNYILHAYAQQYYSQVITFTPKNDGLFKIEKNELDGVVVSTHQALELLSLFGIKIKD